MKMVRVTLICAVGMSTSMLVKKMKEAAEKKGIDAEIRAVAENKFEEYADKTDVLLLGPQVGYMLSKFKQKYEPKGIAVDVINSIDYGMMNGEKVLNTALKMAEKNK
ncbi:MAG TPA: PTS sugar transporter subunit IIB [Soehngenia sp.]|nr:PTS sugar transporter subunit IIB [Soehngenia sp.]HPP31029.1 PTS sugar transporter subunit IIB [Soehngenia sp.]